MKLLTTKELRHFFEKGEGFSMLFGAHGYGAMDGGCLIVAKAYIHAYGRGSLVRIARLSMEGEEVLTDHYGALIDGEILDGVGRHRSAKAWIRIFRWDDTIRVVREGWDETTKIPDDPALVKELAQLLLKRMEQ